MSWNLSTLAIALLGLFATSVMAGEQSRTPASQKSTPAIAASDIRAPAAVKQSDKDLIEKQKTCPVMNQPLGAMGKPVKVVVKNRTVFLCCAGCKKKLLADPDKYLKKLDEKKGDKK